MQKIYSSHEICIRRLVKLLKNILQKKLQFTEIIEYLQTDLAPIIEHILLNASLFAFT